MKRPYYPIIYIRGYAMTQSAVEVTCFSRTVGYLILTLILFHWHGAALGTLRGPLAGEIVLY